VGPLLHILREVGANQQIAELAARAVADASLDDRDGVAMLLHSLREVGEDQQATELAARIIADSVPLDDPGGVARLVDSLQEEEADKRAIELACWAADRVSLDDPGSVARLIGNLQVVGAYQRAIKLARWAAAGVSLDDPGGKAEPGPEPGSAGASGITRPWPSGASARRWLASACGSRHRAIRTVGEQGPMFLYELLVPHRADLPAAYHEDACHPEQEPGKP
jgi:hypothetical protein